MSNRHHIGRRQFLVTSSTCALAAAVLGPNLFAAGAVSAPKRLAVGFASFEEKSVIAASSLPAGDGGFVSRGARVVVNGASGALADPNSRRGVEILAHYSYYEGAERVSTPFRAWGRSRRSISQGSGVGFTVPVDDAQKIIFTLGTETGSADDGTVLVETLPVTLSIRNDDAAFRLVRGFYIIVPLFDDEQEPRWSAWSLDLVKGRRTLVDANAEAAPFEHYVIKVDYAAS